VKIGDLVMFIDTGRYAKWFFGQFATVERYTPREGKRNSCRVRWLNPVKYHDGMSTISDFPATWFEVCE
tara:strand:+ start:437 stop:643 length:207 start_codon:yes stop_codon:yes gene_type:complete